MVIEMREAQLSKADSLMIFIEVGMIIEVREVQK